MMNHISPDRAALRLSAWLLLGGRVLYIVITLLHADGDANNHPAVFAEYAGSDIWKVVHLGQFAAMAVLLAGLFALYFALDIPTGAAMWAARFGAAAAIAALALYGALQAVDGVALKQAVNAWASAPEAEKAARFATAEGMRWVEWGMRSYENFSLGLAVVLFSVALGRSALAPRPLAYLMTLSGFAYMAQGWVVGVEGFSRNETIAINSASALDLVWMTWLVLIARRARYRE